MSQVRVNTGNALNPHVKADRLRHFPDGTVNEGLPNIPCSTRKSQLPSVQGVW